MFDSAFWPALWIGVSIAAPVGPIGVLVIQRTLGHGPALGLATGLGAAVADAVYGAVGAFGVAVVIGALQAVRVPLVLAGAAFLLVLAWRTWQRAGSSGMPAAAAQRHGLAGAFAGTFALTLSNPATLLSFIAVFGAMAGRGAVPEPLPMVAGVLLGSALWWLCLAAAVGALRQRIDARARRWIGRISALMLAAFAAWALASLRAA